ncbi:class I SAM-dependent methyltransferase [Glaciecola sp. MH2013]|uniref:class I SAM-dependent methyltransferase n=1 Tax=Glaciecola sp. MH2013 TaxID=2785524 RepID=UPI00189FFBBD|nr:class I SAM-dependent methyltransferase [Glaciecola sp. MH2013]MBF7072436.1 class I SAM-dependent methyltransferase [Glaciecola sp. MH2013]
MNDTEAWDLYWQSGIINSCVTQSDELVDNALFVFWTSHLSRLPQTPKVLDLATGNGAVVHLLHKAESKLQLTGIDRAKIVSASQHDEHSPQFLSNIDITQTPFKNQSFDLITSQFGVEYAMCTNGTDSMQSVLQEISRLLRPGGIFQLLIHHSESSLLHSNARKRDELAYLLQDGGLISDLWRFSHSDLSVSDLELSGQNYLHTAQIKTQAISGQIFSAINHFIQQQGMPETQGSISDVITRVKAEHSRLKQLCAAAMSEDDLVMMERLAENNDLAIETKKAFEVENKDGTLDLLAWQIVGSKGS